MCGFCISDVVETIGKFFYWNKLKLMAIKLSLFIGIGIICIFAENELLWIIYSVSRGSLTAKFIVAKLN